MARTGRETLIIGAGINGLVCAAVLARRGHRVVVLEAADSPGGAARSVTFGERFEAPLGAHIMPAPDRRLARALDLAQHGWSPPPPLKTVALLPGEPPLALDASVEDPRLDAENSAGWTRFAAATEGLARVLRHRLMAPPLPLGATNRREWWQLVRAGAGFLRAGPRRMRELLRVIGMPVADYVGEYVTDPRLAGALCTEALWGTSYGPQAPGTTLSLLYRQAIGSDRGRWLQPDGGPAAFANAVAASARAAGAELRLATPVRSILVEYGKVTGVELASGEVIRALSVVSALDPVTTLLRLVGPGALETGLVRAARHIRGRGAAGRVLLAVAGDSAWPGLPRAGERAIVGHAPATLERAADAIKVGACSAQPALDMVRVAGPPGHTVLSVTAQFVPLADDPRGNDPLRDELLAAVTRVLESHWPGIGAGIVARACFTPADLAAATGSHGGHWHHAELALDQFLFTRPAAPMAAYRLPVEGLTLAGAGTHPGGGVTGWPGQLAAAEVLRQ